MPTPKITIVGAALCGSLLGIVLARRRWEVDLYERGESELDRTAGLDRLAAQVASQLVKKEIYADAPSTAYSAPSPISPMERTTARSTTHSPATT